MFCLLESFQFYFLKNTTLPSQQITSAGSLNLYLKSDFYVRINIDGDIAKNLKGEIWRPQHTSWADRPTCENFGDGAVADLSMDIHSLIKNIAEIKLANSAREQEARRRERQAIWFALRE